MKSSRKRGKKSICLLLSIVLFLSAWCPFDEGILEKDRPFSAKAAAAEKAVSLSFLTSGGNFPEEIFTSDTDKDAFYYVAEVKEYVNPYYEAVQKYQLIRYDINTNEQTAAAQIDASMVEYYQQNDKIYFLKYGDRADTRAATGSSVLSVFYQAEVLCFDMSAGTLSTVVSIPEIELTNQIVVTEDNRLVLFSYGSVGVYSLENGSFINSTELNSGIYGIIGYDQASKNIYYLGYSNWRYWGYDHDMCSMKIMHLEEDSSVRTAERALSIQYQIGFFEHKSCGALWNGKYLADLSTFSGDILHVLDSSQVSIDNLTDTVTSISMTDSSVSVTPVNLSNAAEATLLSCKTRDSVYKNGRDTSSEGVRAAYFAERNSVFVNTDENQIEEYGLDTKQKTGIIKTEQPVYYTMVVGDRLVAIEKGADGAFYVENISTAYASKITITGPATLEAGKSGAVEASFDEGIVQEYAFTSSDPKVVSVTKKGILAAWKPGTATITVTSKDQKLTDSLSITVSPRTTLKSLPDISEMDGAVTGNTGYVLDSTYGNCVNSYLEELTDGFMRVENTKDKNVLVEYYDKAFQFVRKKKIPFSLSLFGGFYRGTDAYYLVFGQKNPSEDNGKEVVRAVKYDTDWNELASCKLSGMNTYIPFDAGSLRMTELEGKLYIHTCHEMYATKDGYHHQANMTFVIKESDMTLQDSYTDIMNLGEGYVSHSFDQFIQTDGNYIYRVDHGDAGPRGIAFSAVKKENKVGEPTYYGTLFSFSGERGDNQTDANIGGFELAESGMLITANYKNDENTSSHTRNVLTLSLGTDFTDKQPMVNYLTAYTEKDKKTAFRPKLVKLDGNHFLTMWMEYDENTKDYGCKLALIDAEGKLASDIVSKQIYLSDCQPKYLSDGTVSWYISDGKNTVAYNIDPYNLEAMSDDEEREITIYSAPSVKKAKKPVINLKNKKRYKLSKKVVIKSAAGLRKVTLNGKKLGAHKYSAKYAFRLKAYRTKLKKNKKKLNTLIAIDVNGKKTKVRFYVKR